MCPTVQIRLSDGGQFSIYTSAVYMDEWTVRGLVRVIYLGYIPGLYTWLYTWFTPPGLKTSLTRTKVPQGNKSGSESPKQALLDYGKALPGYYSR